MDAMIANRNGLSNNARRRAGALSKVSPAVPGRATLRVAFPAPTPPVTRPLARPLDRAEAFFWLLDRCSSMNFAVMAEGVGPLEAGRLESALGRAAQIHPALAVAIEADGDGRLAFVPRPGARASLAREGDRDVLGPLARVDEVAVGVHKRHMRSTFHGPDDNQSMPGVN